MFIPELRVERLASDLLARCRSRRGALVPPIPVEYIVENILDLRILWQPLGIEKELVLGGLISAEKMIVFNEDARDMIMSTAGLYETVLAHEAGHWCLHADHGASVQPLLTGLHVETTCWYRPSCEDKGFQEVQAHKFMAYLLLPSDLLLPALVGRDLTRWQSLYELREMFAVTISAIVKRLGKLKGLTVDPGTKRLHFRAHGPNLM